MPHLQGTPKNIHIKLILRETMGKIFAADSMGLSSFTFFMVHFKTHVLSNGLHSGCPRLSNIIGFGTNQEHVSKFLLVASSHQ